MKRQLLCATLLAIVATGHVDAQAPSETGRSDKRVALVIGNAAYAVGRLNNPILDARAMAESLRTSPAGDLITHQGRAPDQCQERQGARRDAPGLPARRDGSGE